MDKRIEQILDEIERQLGIQEDTPSHLDNEAFNSGRRKALENLKGFILSYQEVPVIEGLDEAAEDYKQTVVDTYSDYHDETGESLYFDEALKIAFIEGARWQKSRMMKGLCFETKVYLEDDGCAEDYNYTEWLALENTEISEFPEKELGLKPGDTVQVIIVKEDKENEIL